MTGDELLCPACRHAKRLHDATGCRAIRDECWCGWVPPPVLPEAEAFRLPPERPGDAELVPDEPEPEELPTTQAGPALGPEPEPPTPAVPVRVPKPRRPRRVGAPAYAAPGEVLLSYPAWSCLKCSSRRFEAFSCCDKAATPVTVTLTRREGSDG